MLSKFYGSVGVYKTRTLEALNPLHWVETLIFLPREILNYLGVSQANVVSKLLQLIYWFVTAAAFFVWGLYQTQVGLIVKNWIDKLLTP